MILSTSRSTRGPCRPRVQRSSASEVYFNPYTTDECDYPDERIGRGLYPASSRPGLEPRWWTNHKYWRSSRRDRPLNGRNCARWTGRRSPTAISGTHTGRPGPPPRCTSGARDEERSCSCDPRHPQTRGRRAHSALSTSVAGRRFRRVHPFWRSSPSSRTCISLNRIRSAGDGTR